MSAIPTDRPVSRRGAVTGAVGLAMAGAALPVSAQEDPAADLLYEDDVEYGVAGGVSLLLNVVRPGARTTPGPAVVIVHGGGLVQGGRYDHGEAAVALATAGYATFNIEYRLFVDGDAATLWPAQLDDAQLAVRWVRANAAAYDVDPERIAAFGFSSGGQLAAFLGTRGTRDETGEYADVSSKVACVVTLGAPFDFTFEGANPNTPDIDAAVLGGSLDALPDAAAYADFSPISFVDAASAPFLILQEGNDTVIRIEHPMRMMAALQEAGVQVSYNWFPEYDHGSWFAWAPEAPETLAFFARHLRPEE